MPYRLIHYNSARQIRNIIIAERLIVYQSARQIENIIVLDRLIDYTGARQMQTILVPDQGSSTFCQGPFEIVFQFFKLQISQLNKCQTD